MLNNEQGEKMSRAIEQADRLFCDFFKKVKGAFYRAQNEAYKIEKTKKWEKSMNDRELER